MSKYRKNGEKRVHYEGYVSGKARGIQQNKTSAERLEEKREEAETRQLAYSKLSTREKLERVRSRPGQSRRELARLTKKGE